MIDEAIDALGEDGGSAEGSISGFIRARHPGVPAAHDRLLRHYLAKHVAEGFFVCTAPGRYARSPDEAAVVEAPAVAACVGTPVAEAKRGRGRPRKDGSSSTSPAGKKDGSAVATPKRRGRRPRTAPLAADEGSVPTSSIAVADKKDESSQATASTPRRRRGLRKLAVAATTGGLGEALVTNKRDVIGAPSTTDKEHGRSLELALVIAGDGSAPRSIEDKVCGEASPTTPVDRGQPREVALVTASAVSAPTPHMDNEDVGNAPSFHGAPVAKDGGISATSTSSELSGQACELALVIADNGSVPASIADKERDEPPSAAYKRRRQSPRKAAPAAVAAHGSAPASTPAKKAAGGKALSATPKGRRWQRKPALVATGNRSAPAPVAGKKTGSEVPFATPKLALVTAGGSSTPASVADKNGGNEAPAAPKPQVLPRKLYPLTADEVPDDPLFCLLALPACMPQAANA